MSIKDKLMEDLKTAMRSRDTARTGVLRYLRSEIHNQEIEDGKELDDNGVMAVLEKQAKQRHDSIDAFKQGNRPDLVEKEEAQLAVIMGYLPEQLSDDEIAEIAKDVIAEVGASGPGDTGRVMGAMMPRVRGKAEGPQGQPGSLNPAQGPLARGSRLATCLTVRHAGGNDALDAEHEANDEEVRPVAHERPRVVQQAVHPVGRKRPDHRRA